MDNKNSIKESFNSNTEESEDSIEIKLASRRNKNLGKLVYSKITKKLKRNPSKNWHIS